MVLVLLCGEVRAQSVHKCVGGDGAVSYQSGPCPAGSREAKSWQAPPDPPPDARRQRELEEKRRRDREESEYLSRRAGTDRAPGAARSRTASTPTASACEAAKAQRQRTLDGIGLKRTYDLLTRLDEQVRQACR